MVLEDAFAEDGALNIPCNLVWLCSKVFVRVVSHSLNTVFSATLVNWNLVQEVSVLALFVFCVHDLRGVKAGNTLN